MQDKIFLKIKENNDLYIDAQKNIFFIKKKESKFNEAEDLIINLIELLFLTSLMIDQ